MAIRFPLKTEIALGADLTADPSAWAWTDISAYCYVRGGGFVSRRGRGDWQSTSPPSNIGLLLNNRDGRFSRLNPTGPYYGQLRKNTPVRVSANPGSGYVVRATGYVSEWPVEWDLSETDFIVDARADGVLRRLQQGQSPARSALRRTITAVNAAVVPVAYLPLEDSADATEFASGLVDGEPAAIAGLPELASVTDFAGSAAVANFTATANTSIAGFASVSLAGATAGFIGISLTIKGDLASALNPVILQAVRVLFADGSIPYLYVTAYARWTGTAFDTAATGIDVFVSGGPSVGSVIGGFNLNMFDGQPHDVHVRLTQNGTAVDAALWVDAVQVDTNSSAAVTLGTPTTLLGPAALPGSLGGDTVENTGASIALGHVAVYDDASAPAATDYHAAVGGYIGELAGDRFERLCLEDGVPSDVTAGSTSAMGVQEAQDLLALLRECEAAEAGLIVERRTGELGFDPVSARYNLDPLLELDYAQRHIAPPLRPTDDDRLTRNDVTVSRMDGSSARVVDHTGPMGVEAVGRYDESLTLNLSDDDQSVHAAGWRVNLGTVDEYRYPRVNLKLHSPVLASLRDDIVSVDVGSRTTIANLPDNLPPDLVDLIVEGINERIDNFTWDVELVCSPYKPYKVFEIADTTGDQNEWLGRLAGDPAAALRVTVDDNDLSFEVDPNRTRFTTVADDFDPDIDFRLGGEVVRVSSIATTAGTFVTVGAMSSADNAAVTPALYAGNAVRDLILVVGGIRSASAGTISMPADYTRLRIKGFSASSPLQVWAKVHDGSEPNPTVTPTGGAAGDTVSAVTIGLRGMPCTLDDLQDLLVDSLGQSNASAQNIAYPGLFTKNQEGCIFLVIGRKDDDWTSVATLSGFTEAVDSSTTTGSDQGLVVDYQIQTTPAVVNEGSLVVTGGAAAVSEGAVLALAAGFQTFTVSARAVNGVTKSHAAATRIEVEDAMVLAL